MAGSMQQHRLLTRLSLCSLLFGLEPSKSTHQVVNAFHSFSGTVTISPQGLIDHPLPLTQGVSHEAQNELRKTQEDGEDEEHVTGTHQRLAERNSMWVAPWRRSNSEASSHIKHELVHEECSHSQWRVNVHEARTK